MRNYVISGWIGVLCETNASNDATEQSHTVPTVFVYRWRNTTVSTPYRLSSLDGVCVTSCKNVARFDAFPGWILKVQAGLWNSCPGSHFPGRNFSRQDISHLDLDFRVCSQTQSNFPARFQNLGGKFSGLEIPGWLPGKWVLPVRWGLWANITILTWFESGKSEGKSVAAKVAAKVGDSAKLNSHCCFLFFSLICISLMRVQVCFLF